MSIMSSDESNSPEQSAAPSALESGETARKIRLGWRNGLNIETISERLDVDQEFVKAILDIQ